MRRTQIAITLLMLLMVGVVACSQKPTPTPAGNSGSVPSTPGALPDLAQKPTPQEVSSFNGCPPQGDSGDPVLNRLKNRVDDAGAYYPVLFNAVEKLAWPPGIERKDHAKWSASDAATVARYEGIPISVEGYLFDAKQQGPESTNCHGSTPEMSDWHVWLTQNAGEDRTQSIVVETTPRVRPSHPTWTLKALENFAKNKQRVRISGWLMLDPEHPDQVGKTRGTIWEIHPIMKIEVQEGGSWKPL